MFRSVPPLLAVLVCAANVSAQPQLPADKLAAIKRATVMVKVDSGTAAGSGSGFLVRVEKTTGYIATNSHVVNLSDDHRPRRGEVRDAAVEVVFDSGLPTERTAPARVVADDPDHDLAIIKVENVKNLPAPLDLANPPKLVETMPVLVCGFPFGESLATGRRHPAITIGKASVSSVRTDEAGQVAVVQLDGALNPGNSGGPIVTPDGKLVGVAVATIRGAGIGLAVPYHELHRLLAGRVGAAAVYVAPAGPDNLTLRLEVPLIDPLGRVKSVTAYHMPARSGDRPPQPDAAGRWGKLAGGQPAPLTIGKDGWAAVAVAIPRDGRTGVWVQVEYTTADGLTWLTLAAEHALPAFKPDATPADGKYLTAARRSAEKPRIGSKTAPPLKDLNRDPGQYLGVRVTVDAAVTAEVTAAGHHGDLTVMFGPGAKASNVRFRAAVSLAEQVRKLDVPAGEVRAARLVGTVVAPEPGGGGYILDVEEVALLGPDGSVTAALKPTAEPAAAPPTSPQPQTAAADAKLAAGPPVPVPVVAAGGVGLLGAATAAVMVLGRRRKSIEIIIPDDEPEVPPADADTDRPARRGR